MLYNFLLTFTCKDLRVIILNVRKIRLAGAVSYSFSLVEVIIIETKWAMPRDYLLYTIPGENLETIQSNFM